MKKKEKIEMADDNTKESHDLLISAEMTEKAEAEDTNVDHELENAEVFKTQNSDGHTYNPHLAMQQGLTYTPPTDPPVLGSDAPQGAKVAAGFAPSMEESNPDVEILPTRVDNNDLDLLENIYLALDNNSETGHLSNVKVQVNQGIVNLLGTVESEDDLARVYEIVQDLTGVVEVQNNLQVNY
jgi:hypothetical protein